MKLDSKYFDKIRIKNSGKNAPKRKAVKQCEWQGCTEKAEHRAPKHNLEKEFHWFCLKHVREYNNSYNFFEGMSDKKVKEYQSTAHFGHRPTWNMSKSSKVTVEGDAPRFFAYGFRSARFFEDNAVNGSTRETRVRKLKPLEKQAFDTLELEASASREEIKTRYKELVKRHHPDNNGGDRSSEERLRQVINAYKHLKKAGLG